jgi:hypothetical protein
VKIWKVRYVLLDDIRQYCEWIEKLIVKVKYANGEGSPKLEPGYEVVD